VYVLTFAIAGVALLATGAWLFERAQRKQRGVFTRWPIRSVTLPEVDPVFRQEALGPALSTEVSLVGGSGVMALPGGTSDTEAWILAVLGKQSRMMFEFGTCTGRTAYLWARNSASDAKVVTLTLSPDGVASYRRENGDAGTAMDIALQESAFDNFYYSGTPYAGKVKQLFGDSKTFDETPWAGLCDLVFVDGSHAKSYVLSDSRKALRLVRPGGLVLWHDYRGYKLAGVFETLNDLSLELPLLHIRTTSLVAYRRPALVA
jgi:hypothetical protein